MFWFDLSGGEGSEVDKVRPALIVQADYYEGLETVLAVPLSSRLERARQPTGVSLLKAETGLDHDSVALCHLLGAFDKSRIVPGPNGEPGPVGRLGQLAHDRVLQVVTDLLGVDAETFLAE